MDENAESGGQKELIDMVQKAGLCTGCGACVNLCPYQVSYQDRTVVLHACDKKNGRCYVFCPRTKSNLDALRKAFFAETDLTPEIGAVKGYYIARARDEENRKDAQHGGVVTALISLALEEGLIDTAIVAEGKDEFLHRGVAVKDPKDVRKRGKSKFIVSPTVAEFNRAARTEAGKIGVVATPCQALALAKMRMKPFPENESNIDKLGLVVGLFCGWTLSWRQFCDLLGRQTSLEDIQGMDIPPGKRSVEVYTKGGAIVFPLNELAAITREACLYCADTTAEFSDISVGSARIPGRWEEIRSWNQIIVRTKQGQELLNLAGKKGVLEFREVPGGELRELKDAAAGKKRAAYRKLIEKSGNEDDLLYLDRRDAVVSAFI